jgi:hypothetical protein
MSSSPIPGTWDVPASIRDRVGAKGGRQRALVADGHLVLILHAPPNPDEPVKREHRYFWRRPDGLWRSSGGGPTSVAPLRAHVEELTAQLEALDDAVDAADSASDYFEVLRRVTPLMRTSRNMHAALQEARTAIPDRDLISLRDSANDAERAAELIATEARTGLDFRMAKSAEEQAERQVHMAEAGHRLNLLAALFFPITALGSILGMNLVHGFEAWNAPYTFWFVSLGAFAIGWAIRASLPSPMK